MSLRDFLFAVIGGVVASAAFLLFGQTNEMAKPPVIAEPNTAADIKDTHHAAVAIEALLMTGYDLKEFREVVRNLRTEVALLKEQAPESKQLRAFDESLQAYLDALLVWESHLLIVKSDISFLSGIVPMDYENAGIAVKMSTFSPFVEKYKLELTENRSLNLEKARERIIAIAVHKARDASKP